MPCTGLDLSFATMGAEVFYIIYFIGLTCRKANSQPKRDLYLECH